MKLTNLNRKGGLTPGEAALWTGLTLSVFILCVCLGSVNPFIHVEAKHYKTKAFDYEWIDQAKRDAKDKIPAVFHKTDNHEVLVTMTLDDWFTIYREYEAGRSFSECKISKA